MKHYIKSLPIRIKLTAPMVGALAVMLVSVYVYFPRQHKKNLMQAYTREATRTAELFTVAVAYALNQHSFELLQKTLQNAWKDAHISYIFLLEENGETLAAYSPLNNLPPKPPFEDGAALDTTGREMIITQKILANDAKAPVWLVFGYSLENLNQMTRNVRILTILFAFVAFVFGLAFINRVSTRITSSISTLHRQMQETIDKGSYSSDVPIVSDDEVGRLAGAFNKMMQELRSRHQHLVESQERYLVLNKKLRELNRLKTMFVSDASHHLRTPLTIIHGEVEVTLQKDREPLEYQETLNIVLEETQHLGKIVENLLTLAKADTGNLLVIEDAVNLSAICEDQIRHAQILAKDKEVVLNSNIENNCFFSGDPNRLSEAILILLENAIKYTPAGKKVNLSLESEHETIVIKVEDTGIGISENEKDKIFERFYRGKNSSSYTNGSGLGLAICESIIKAHKGKIRVLSAPGKGSIFELRLKRTTIQDEVSTEALI